MLVLNGGNRLVHFFPSSFGQPEMPPDAGHGKRESAPATIPVCYVFPAPKPPCPAFARRGNGRQDRLGANAAGGTPATASHARMTMTVTGLPSRRQESRASPLPVAPPFLLFPWRVAPFHTFSPFPFRLSKCMANVPMPPFQTASVVIFVAGAKVKTGLGTQIFVGKISTLRRLR